MTSPNEPGYPRSGDGPVTATARTATTRCARSADATACGSHVTALAARRLARAAPRPGDAAPTARVHAGRSHGVERAARRATPPGADARLNRFISGGAAPHAGTPSRRRARLEPRRSARPTPVNCRICPARRRARRSARPPRSAPSRRRAGHRHARGGCRSHAARRARCGPACRSAASTRGAR